MPEEEIFISKRRNKSFFKKFKRIFILILKKKFFKCYQILMYNIEEKLKMNLLLVKAVTVASKKPRKTNPLK